MAQGWRQALRSQAAASALAWGHVAMLSGAGILGPWCALAACAPSGGVTNAAGQPNLAGGAAALAASEGLGPSQPGLMVSLAEGTPLVGQVGDRLTLAPSWYLDRDAQGGLNWSVLTPDTAAIEGADGLRLLAPGAVRVRARQGQWHKDFLLAALPSSPTAVDLGSVPGPDWRPDRVSLPLVWFQGSDDWQAWMSVLPPKRREAPPSAWDLNSQDLLVVQVDWGNTNEKAPVVLTHRDASGLWNLVVCDRAPVMLLPMTDFTQRAFLVPKEAGPLRLRRHDRRGESLREAVRPEALATPASATLS